MEIVEAAEIIAGAGLEGDHKGPKLPKRGVSILALEDWQSAIAMLADLAGPVPLPWTARRANLLVEGVRLPRARGSLLRVGDAVLEITAQSYPCRRMEEAHPGLMKALAPNWRGGVVCRVIAGARVQVGDAVEIYSSLPEHEPKLPA